MVDSTLHIIVVMFCDERKIFEIESVVSKSAINDVSVIFLCIQNILQNNGMVLATILPTSIRHRKFSIRGLFFTEQQVFQNSISSRNILPILIYHIY